MNTMIFKKNISILDKLKYYKLLNIFYIYRNLWALKINLNEEINCLKNLLDHQKTKFDLLINQISNFEKYVKYVE